ncbi:hypothetical protein [Paraburkholderia ferrariae]|nr:hypothetical protein [Paraburkholderia ferrariae]
MSGFWRTVAAPVQDAQMSETRRKAASLCAMMGWKSKNPANI